VFFNGKCAEVDGDEMIYHRALRQAGPRRLRVTVADFVSI